MSRHPLPLSTAFAALLGSLAPAPAPAQTPASASAPVDEVTIYRCTGADGRVSIGNLPCAGGERQQARGMLRPTDARPRADAVPATPAAPAAPAPVQVVVVRDPQPIYECTTPDGARYDSDDGEGNPRWVPYWTSGGIGPGYGRAIGARGVTVASGSGLSAPGPSGISVPGSSGISVPGGAGVSAPIPGVGARPPAHIGRPPPARPPHGGWRDDAYGGGVWIRDSCERLPAAEACARLDDRLGTLRRRFFNAQQRERDVLRVDERTLVARFAQDCTRG